MPDPGHSQYPARGHPQQASRAPRRPVREARRTRARRRSHAGATSPAPCTRRVRGRTPGSALSTPKAATATSIRDGLRPGLGLRYASNSSGASSTQSRRRNSRIESAISSNSTKRVNPRKARRVRGGLFRFRTTEGIAMTIHTPTKPALTPDPYAEASPRLVRAAYG